MKSISNKSQFVIDEDKKPYIIAEIGVNHEGSIEKAKELIDLAKEGGAHAAKFQSYKASTLASKNSPSYWDLKKEPTTSQYQLFKKYDSFNAKDYQSLSEYCREKSIDFLSTPFDDESIDFLDPLVPFFKIASADITNIPFLKKIANKNKPIIISTGASTLSEIEIALNTIKQINNSNAVLMHCILSYPTLDIDANLSMISSLKRVFPEHTIGYSDHTLPDKNMTTLVSSYILGATVIEKHFTDNKKLPGNDHYHAMDVHDLRNFNETLSKINLLLGQNDYKKPVECEFQSRKNARRSIVIKKDLKKGHIIKEENITYKRPGTGISPLHWDQVIGKTLKVDLSADHILDWSDFI